VVSSATGVRIGLGCAAAAWGSLVVGSACGDGQGEITSFAPVERSLCDKIVECDCGQSFAALGLVAPLSCDGWTIADAVPYEYYGGIPDEDFRSSHEHDARSIDEQCLRQIAGRTDSASCTDTIDPYFALGHDCRDFCWPIVGPALEGYECGAQADCGRGLLCDAGECRDPCTPRVPLVRPGQGERCIQGECAPGLRCDADGVNDPLCTPLVATGNPCMGHRECASDYCPAGYCVDAPVTGGCGVDGACGPGTTCVEGPDGNPACVPIADGCTGLAEFTFALAVEVVAGGG